MQLHCPACTTRIERDGINLVKTIAVCKSCANVFDFTEQLRTAPPPVPYTATDHHVPTGINLVEFADGLEISFRRRRAGSSFNFMFSLFWNTFLVVVTALVGSSGGWGVLLLLTPFYLVGIWLLYLSVGYLVNTTTIFVDQHFIAVEHRPINFLVHRDKYYTPEETDQLYVKRYSPGSRNEQKVWAYSVHLKLKHGADIQLLTNLHSADSARYIERQIEAYLGITNRRMEGEYA